MDITPKKKNLSSRISYSSKQRLASLIATIWHSCIVTSDVRGKGKWCDPTGRIHQSTSNGRHTSFGDEFIYSNGFCFCFGSNFPLFKIGCNVCYLIYLYISMNLRRNKIRTQITLDIEKRCIQASKITKRCI